MAEAELLKKLGTVGGEAPAMGTLSQSTCKTYKVRLDALMKVTGKPLIASLIDAKRSHSALEKEYDSAVTRANIVYAVMATFKYAPGFAKEHATSAGYWMERRQELAQQESERRDNNRMTTKMQKKFIDIQKTQVSVANLERKGLGTLQSSQEHLLMSMMVNMPPKRNDLGTLHVYRERPAKDEGNYVIVPRSGDVTLVLNEYKTAKKNGPLRESIPKGVAKSMRQSLQSFPRRYVFVGKSGDKMSDSQYGVFVKDIFQRYTGKIAGVNAIRHAYITQMCNPRTMTREELKATAKSMCHSVDMQGQYHVVGGAGE